MPANPSYHVRRALSAGELAVHWRPMKGFPSLAGRVAPRLDLELALLLALLPTCQLLRELTVVVSSSGVFHRRQRWHVDRLCGGSQSLDPRTVEV